MIGAGGHLTIVGYGRWLPTYSLTYSNSCTDLRDAISGIKMAATSYIILLSRL